jgi:hypothetical protein
MTIAPKRRRRRCLVVLFTSWSGTSIHRSLGDVVITQYINNGIGPAVGNM